MTMRLALILMLSFSALSQDENIGQLLWNLPGTIVGIDAAVIGKELEAGGFLLDMGGKALNSLVGAGEGKTGDLENFFQEPAAGGSAPDSTVNPVKDGSAPDSTVNPVKDGSAPGDTVDPASSIENTVEQTKEKSPNEIMTNPPSNLPGQPVQSEPDKTVDVKLSVTTGEPIPPKPSVDHECDPKASLHLILQCTCKVL